jgi:AAA ATPase domain
VHPAAGDGVAGIVGRESELKVLGEFVTPAASGAALVLKGSPGVGKTTLWQAGRDAALGHGMRVISARPNSAETSLSFVSLADLLDGIEPEALDALPAPQRRGLEVALLRADPDGEAATPRAMAFGLLNLLRQLAASRPLLLAVDDLQWLDQPTAEMLAFAVRRLDGPSVRFLFAARAGPSSAVERALAPAGPQILEVGPLSVGAMRRMLSDRLGLALPRYVLRQVFETTLGYPLFALEVGRTLAERGVPALGQDLPVPDTVEELLGKRVSRLAGPVRRLLLALALGGDLDWHQLASLAGPGAVKDALAAGVVADGERARAAHPLLAAAARKHSDSAEYRACHLELAEVVAEGDRRARHLALGTLYPGEGLARVIAGGAATAAARGAAREAAELGEHALRLTPPESDERVERMLRLASYLERAGERQRVTDLLEPELSSLPGGGPRVRAWLLLSEGEAISSGRRQRLSRLHAGAESDHCPGRRRRDLQARGRPGSPPGGRPDRPGAGDHAARRPGQYQPADRPGPVHQPAHSRDARPGQPAQARLPHQGRGGTPARRAGHAAVRGDCALTHFRRRHAPGPFGLNRRARPGCAGAGPRPGRPARRWPGAGSRCCRAPGCRGLPPR